MKINVFVLTLLLFFLPGCVWKKYCPPSHPAPQQFSNLCTAGVGNPVCDWWRQFCDSQLNKLIDQAIETNYDLGIALEKIEESRAFYKIKRAELFPQIDVAGAVRTTKFSERVEQFFSLMGKRVSFFQIGFDAFWELDVWGKIWREKRARYHAFEADIEDMRDVYIMLLADVARTYITLRSLEAQRALLCERLDNDIQLVCLQEDRFSSGLNSYVEVAQQKQVEFTTQAAIRSVQIAFVQTRNQLAVLLGKNPEDLCLASLPNTVPRYCGSVEVGLPSTLLRRRPDIRRAERLLAASYQLTGQAIAEWFPSFALLGSVFTEASKGSDWFKNGSITWQIGPTVRWPLINFGRIKAQVDTRKSQERQAELTYSKTVITAFKDVEDFLVAYFKNKEQTAFFCEKLKQAALQKQLVHDRYVGGLADQLENLNAEQSRIQVELEYIRAVQVESVTLVSLYKALGGGW